MYVVRHSNINGVKRMFNEPRKRRDISFSVALAVDDSAGIIDKRGRLGLVDVN